MKVFLGGTCANSKWRDKLIPRLEEFGIEYFNPVVKKWDEEARKREIYERENCDIVLYVLTRTWSTYSIAEVVDDSNKRPEKTICCIFNERDKNNKWIMSNSDIKHLNQVGKMVERNGGSYCNNLKNVVKKLLEKITYGELEEKSVRWGDLSK